MVTVLLANRFGAAEQLGWVDRAAAKVSGVGPGLSGRRKA